MVEIRKMTALDFDKGLFECLSALSPSIKPKDAGDIFRKRLKNGLYGLVAASGERIVGTASYFIEWKLTRGGGSVCHIEDVAVLEGMQGQGIGGDLINRIKEIAEEEGCRKIVLSCNDSNTKFYEQFGFDAHETTMVLNMEGK